MFYVCLLGLVCTIRSMSCLWRPEEGTGSPTHGGAGGTEIVSSPVWVLGAGPRSLALA